MQISEGRLENLNSEVCNQKSQKLFEIVWDDSDFARDASYVETGR